MESGCDAMKSGIECSWRPRRWGAVVGVFTVFLSLALLTGCFRDPNVRKHKYLESGAEVCHPGQGSGGGHPVFQRAEDRQELCRSALCSGADLSSYGRVECGLRRTAADAWPCSRPM